MSPISLSQAPVLFQRLRSWPHHCELVWGVQVFPTRPSTTILIITSIYPLPSIAHELCSFHNFITKTIFAENLVLLAKMQSQTESNEWTNTWSQHESRNFRLCRYESYLTKNYTVCSVFFFTKTFWSLKHFSRLGFDVLLRKNSLC